MIIITSVLAYSSKLFSNTIFLVIGNILSLVISFYFVSEMAGNERWMVYFNPLSPYQLLIVGSILNLIPQFIVTKVVNKYKRKVTN
ncbi:hypothetical protein ACFSTH_13010 [Paenibacillus yanchengensis]|uniref:ECF transporter S component n=1 Tax=Paenibacillus yanchengensis TaxID=2035833 RepID=A0ABW4YPA9_9BACL